MTHAHHATTPAHAAFSLTGLHCTGCADAVEQALKASPHIASVQLDWPNNVVHVGYHAGMIDKAAIQGIIEATGCPCAGDAHAAHAGSTMLPQARLEHLRHGVDVQPITMGTKQDRMQYELAATPIHAQHSQHAAVPPAGHAGMDHSQHAGMDHGAMGHDMSDPSMAAAMERDMRNTFFIALLLTIPTVLYSPMGVNILGLRLPTFGLSMDLIMLALTTPVVFYCGWMFIAGAYHSLRLRALNMSVRVATGVLAAYLGSLP
jgi:Cu2+-exporting ATPase